MYMVHRTRLLNFFLIRHIVERYRCLSSGKLFVNLFYFVLYNKLHNLTGYGPRIITMDSQTIKWLVFNGKAENYPAWSTKFTAYMQTKGLYKALLGKEITVYQKK